MPEAALSLGANLGDAPATMARALREIVARGVGRRIAVSSLWRTPPWGKTDQPDFFNAAALIDTALSPRDLLRALQGIEADLGRVRGEKWGPRLIDIDIVAYDALALNDPDLILPHEQAGNRAFVLAPLSEIAPDLRLGAVTAREALALLDSKGLSRVASPAEWLIASSSPTSGA